MGVERKGGRKVDGVMDRPTEDQPAAVPAEATQAGEIRARWAFYEHWAAMQMEGATKEKAQETGTPAEKP